MRSRKLKWESPLLSIFARMLLSIISSLPATFLVSQCIIPIEVKAEENLKAKSLGSFFEKFKPTMSVRTSMSDYRKESWLVNVPLYAIDSFSF
jgi:hypothetical protein